MITTHTLSSVVLLTIMFQSAITQSNIRQAENYRLEGEHYLVKANEYRLESESYSMQAETYMSGAASCLRIGDVPNARTRYNWANKAMDRAEANLTLYEENSRKASLKIKMYNKLISKNLERGKHKNTLLNEKNNCKDIVDNGNDSSM